MVGLVWINGRWRKKIYLKFSSLDKNNLWFIIQRLDRSLFYQVAMMFTNYVAQKYNFIHECMYICTFKCQC